MVKAFINDQLTGMVVPRQVHGDQVRYVSGNQSDNPEADALFTDQPGLFIGILVADCFPLLLFDPDRPALAVVHAGWRGTAANIQAKTVSAMQKWFATVPQRLSVVIGPGIGPCCFEVGDEVVRTFQTHRGFTDQWIQSRSGREFLNLPAVIYTDFLRCGISPRLVETVPMCTFCRKDLFHSFRRDGNKAGRMLLGAALLSTGNLA